MSSGCPFLFFLALLFLLSEGAISQAQADGFGHIEIRNLGLTFFKGGLAERPQAEPMPLHDTPRAATAANMPHTYLLDPAKFDDLTARSLLIQGDRDAGQQFGTQNVFSQQVLQSAQQRIMNEYLRRIYQGYSSAIIEDSRKKQATSSESLLDVGRNILVTYQALPLLSGLESRFGYDVIGNATHFALVTPAVSTELVYYLMDAKSKASIPEHVISIDEAMDQFAAFDRMSVNVSHSFAGLGMRAKVMYGVTSGTLDYGFSKSLFGPFAVQVVREENYQRDLPGNMVFQLTVGQRF
ncbi:MAG: hypothetical protein HY074_01950 [Deltaproteobacteria bacterium]|nr:hypothetical protein [Deltaproteobacteria bacterium]